MSQIYIYGEEVGGEGERTGRFGGSSFASWGNFKEEGQVS